MNKITTIITLFLVFNTQIFATYYYQGKLSDIENKMYITVATSLLEEKNTIEINPLLNKAQIQKVNKAIFMDLPQLFYVKQSYNYKWRELPDGTITSSYLVYSFKDFEKNIHSTRTDVHNKVLEYINEIKNLETDVQKVTEMYRFFALSRDYDLSLKNDQSCYSALMDKKGICASYAKAFQYIMIYSGIECIYVTGTLNGTSHAWNMIKIDDNWYNVDVTNGNTGFDDYVTYQNLLIPSKTIMKTIVIDDLENIPIANSDKYNYYKNNDLYIETFSQKNISNRVKKATINGRNGITFEVADSSSLNKIKEYLITDQTIYSLINTDSITYSINQDRLLITIHF